MEISAFNVLSNGFIVMPPVLAIVLFLLAGVGTESLTLEVEGLERQALVFPGESPPGPDGAPLVLAFHGRGGKVRVQSRILALQEAWPEAVVVYPQGQTGVRGRFDRRGRMTGWQSRPGQNGDRDLKFVDALLEEIRDRYEIDPSRIYAVGHSNGGIFVGMLWHSRPDRFAAFASACGQAEPHLIREAEPRPVMMLMGRRDRIVRFGVQRLSLNTARELFEVDVAGSSKSGYLRTYPAGDDHELVTYVHPGGHAWPSEAVPHIIDFFKRHRLTTGAASP